MAFFVRFGVESDAFFVNLMESEWSRRSVVSNCKIETKNDASVKCDFDVTIGFSNFEKFRIGIVLDYDIRKIFGIGLESELNLLK